jgi:hypothetical protein
MKDKTNIFVLQMISESSEFTRKFMNSVEQIKNLISSTRECVCGHWC